MKDFFKRFWAFINSSRAHQVVFWASIATILLVLINFAFFLDQVFMAAVTCAFIALVASMVLDRRRLLKFREMIAEMRVEKNIIEEKKSDEPFQPFKRRQGRRMKKRIHGFTELEGRFIIIKERRFRGTFWLKIFFLGTMIVLLVYLFGVMD